MKSTAPNFALERVMQLFSLWLMFRPNYDAHPFHAGSSKQFRSNQSLIGFHLKRENGLAESQQQSRTQIRAANPLALPVTPSRLFRP
jgi:hypothetical protein